MLWASWCKKGLENLKRGNHSEDRSGARMREEAERVGFVQLENRLRGNLIAVCKYITVLEMADSSWKGAENRLLQQGKF